MLLKLRSRAAKVGRIHCPTSTRPSSRSSIPRTALALLSASWFRADQSSGEPGNPAFAIAQALVYRSVRNISHAVYDVRTVLTKRPTAKAAGASRNATLLMDKSGACSPTRGLFSRRPSVIRTSQCLRSSGLSTVAAYSRSDGSSCPLSLPVRGVPHAARPSACLLIASTPDVPFCAAGKVATAGVLARRSAPERVRPAAPTTPAAERGSACCSAGADGLPRLLLFMRPDRTSGIVHRPSRVLSPIVVDT